MKRILVGGAGGTPSNNFIKSLRQSGEDFYIIGMTSNKYDLAKAEVDEKHMIPRADHKHYERALQDLIEKTKPDFLHVQNDLEVEKISEIRDRLDVKTFLPSKETVDICVDKIKSYQKWSEAGIPVPETMEIKTPEDLKDAISKYGEVWLRIRKGAFGYGALKTRDFDFAKAWIDFYKGWGDFSAAEYLSPQSVTWMSLWKDGELIAAQGRLRLYWEFANRNISGITGITGTGITISDPKIDEMSLRVIKAIDTKPNGIFSVDLTYDKNSVPNPTEINIGRFFTTHDFFTKAGLNMPYIYLKAAFGEKSPPIKKKINPLPAGLAWVRGMDTDPVLIPLKQVESWEKELNQKLKKYDAE